jgi:hypothetical protein
MNSIYFDSTMTDAERRERLYQGQLFAYAPRPTTTALCDFAREMAEAAFAPLDPRQAQHSLPVERFAAILAELKPKFIHHPKSKELIRNMLEDLGCDLDEVFFDVPRMRTATHANYLSTGIAYAFHPHRDTWYSAPHCQLNWWLPMYDLEPENALAFHPRYWSQPVKNGSSGYDYYEWNRTSRRSAAQHIKSDTRKQPHADEPLELDPQVRIVGRAGSVIIFSAAQMHSTVPNTSGYTRFSVDFRTVHLEDVANVVGAPNIDSAPTGTTLRDFLRASDLSRIPESLVALYDPNPPEDAELIYQHDTVQSQK